MRFPEGIDVSGCLADEVEDGKVEGVGSPVTFFTAGDNTEDVFGFRGGAPPLEDMFLLGEARCNYLQLNSQEGFLDVVGEDLGKAGSDDFSAGDNEVFLLLSIA